MTFEEFLKRAYGVAMTPLPAPPSVDVGPLMEALRGVSLPSMGERIGELPVMPEAWKRYAEEQGLFPAERDGSVR
jgi:hypothetical protein